ncbi:hypothetical protein COU62_01660 [Candidatus Pacearchaeota archaeon CG10_big_fil_rev_8_21_14_0_10_35_219]|nr:hypothetical protein [Candidatus Pacearchaeota archaeon]OIO43141.1 MAG: hypothetical protein AUJ63_00935 [Candidatus Pacearchaeota archaeon CG1_02_35_32]PIO08070.1 MAG: hypothetical protein COU62_01660 [Candidatus Pacearchaeota archaeon CG10_big_fil_rev_8_21_14_0_10_35_219]PIY81583.1 MAG: hypothetical protein COY79_02495 [Candidatus Pacearchaeota archaeon CG_4_10_14_0_8_um_filter_35_169]PIZ78958.1 MAG: hypothetical protein COY00_04880 [Candidatus Pacearchaeota archaeon CG_4_10_14_0_2_um_filt
MLVGENISEIASITITDKKAGTKKKDIARIWLEPTLGPQKSESELTDADVDLIKTALTDSAKSSDEEAVVYGRDVVDLAKKAKIVGALRDHYHNNPNKKISTPHTGINIQSYLNF